MQITAIGLDIAKHVFQVHGIDATAHYWALESTKLGHEVRLMPATGLQSCGSIATSIMHGPSWVVALAKAADSSPPVDVAVEVCDDPDGTGG
jgi:hypothetical protein